METPKNISLFPNLSNPRFTLALSRFSLTPTSPWKKRVATSYASREVMSESTPPWHLWTNVRGAPGSCAALCLTRPSLRLYVQPNSCGADASRFSADAILVP